MSKLTPAEATAKHARNLKAAIPDIQRGVDRVTENPGVKAAANKDKWVAKLMDPAIQDKWERNTRALDLGAWKDITKKKVSSNLASGVDAAAPKMNNFYTQLFPFQDSLVARINAMPDLTLEDSIARMTTMVRGMAEFKLR